MNNNANLTPDLFSDDRFYIRPKELFYYLFNEVCSIYTFHNCEIRNDELHEAVIEKYSKNSGYKVYSDIDFFYDKGTKNHNTYYVLGNNLLLWIFKAGVSVFYKHEEINSEVEEIKTLVAEKIIDNKSDKNKFYMIFNEYGFLELKEFKTKIIPTDINTHYNDSFKKVDNKIKEFITNDKTGIVLLHGKSGTGKTSYIRHLINTMDKQFIYLPAELVTELTKPSFLPFLTEHPNCIYFIEDCEELLMQRTHNSSTNHALLNLLNISDGLIGDGISIKFICTFNSSIKLIDEALLRKGRLIAKYEFKELTSEKANLLIETEKLSIPKFSDPVSLSDIYNYDGTIETKSHKKIGFGI